ncbi:DUF3783 domain-containing protein [Marinomonas pollencensis]|uniref:RAQPRD family integrative conjugative element protein n=1 Tax=Marinomonas pollencensis TaxID=491954 RepID=A0A3E0DUN1_9GAMM|nr:DUF3783 domain-containing protein [Marinomonas pollencensis]REG85832.1 hypothetical protein DFP81_102371 [Marinomonas pollencensis]
MQKIKLLLPILVLVLSTNLYASESDQYNKRLDQDRALLNQLVSQLKQHGVKVKATVTPNSLSSKMEEHAVLQAKILHYQRKLQKIIASSYCANADY